MLNTHKNKVWLIEMSLYLEWWIWADLT